MDIVFTDNAGKSDTTGLWPIYCERRQLLITLRQASQRAVRTGHNVLASFSQPVEPCNPKHIFTAFQLLEIGESFFWEQPAEHKTLVRSRHHHHH